MRANILAAALPLVLVPSLLATAACQSSDATAGAATRGPEVVLGGQVIDPAALAQAGATSQPTSAPTGEPSDDPRPGPLAPGETGHYGAPFTIEGDPLSLAEALQTCVGTGQPCLVEGTVARVCQVSGCWFTVAAPEVQAVVRIRMHDYGFFVPRNAVGAAVVFQGTLELEQVPEETAQHYADDEAAAGGEPRVVDGPELTYEFVITGARLRMPPAG